MDLDLLVRTVLQPQRYAQPTLDGHLPDVDVDLPRRLRAEAALILSLAGPDTDRREVAWAAGVMLIRDATMLIGPLVDLALSMERSGGSLHGNRMYRADRSGVRVTCGARTVAAVTWHEVAAVASAAFCPPALTQQIEGLAEAQAAAARVDDQDEQEEQDQTGPQEAEELELRSRLLAAQVWDLAGPEDPLDVLVRQLTQ